MNIQQLKYFSEVCRCGSFSKAAENLYISQQGLSMAIIRLESEFSCKLFVRTPKGLTVTTDGEFLLEQSKVILSEFERCERHFSEQPQRECVINVAGAQGVLAEFAAMHITAFKDTHQQYELYLREYTDRACDTMVENMEAELGLGVEPIDHKKFDCYPLFSKRLVLLVHERHPLAKETSVPVSRVQNLPMVLVDEKLKSADYFLHLCKQQGVEPDVQMRVGEIVAVHRIVSKSCYIAGLSVESVAEALRTPNTVAVPIDDSAFAWTVDLFKRKDAELTLGAKTFADYLMEQIPPPVLKWRA